MSASFTRIIQITCKPVMANPKLDEESLNSFIRLSVIRVQEGLSDLLASGITTGNFMYGDLGANKDESLSVAWELQVVEAQ